MKSIGEWLKSNNVEELSEMLRSLAHPARLAILYLLSAEEKKRMSVKCVYEQLQMPQPVISRHLGILKNCGLVIRVQEGPVTFYELNEKNETAVKITTCFSNLK